jgi:hypothetical protein
MIVDTAVPPRSVKDALQLVWRSVKHVISTLLAVAVGLLHDVAQAFADSLASRDLLYLKSLHPAIEAHRDGAFRKFAERIASTEDTARELLDALDLPPPSTATLSSSAATPDPLLLRFIMRRQQERLARRGEEPLSAEAAQRIDDAGLRALDEIRQRLNRRSPRRRARRFCVAFEVEGRADSPMTVQVQPQVLFRGCKLIATDDSDDAGNGTLIVGMFVGNQPQMVTFGPGVPTSEFLYYKRCNEIDFDACDPALSITLQLRFLRDCKWNGVIFGEAIS